MKDTQEAQRAIAEGLGLSTGELDKCDVCGDTIRGDGKHVESIAQGLREFHAGGYEGIFSSEAEVQKAVYDTINEYPSDECERCSLESKG